ncbi:unnamed protein product [Nezara viridula]|uniref:Uncharacterized protein n=1 Tax=Nezara viridula TaxID=85310 RepID=A0A9P0H3Z9_NEZVI|nr:unnamed protein product [Nezara viridula]
MPTAHHKPDTQRLVFSELELDFQPTSSGMDNQEYMEISNENIESAAESSESEDEHKIDDINENPNWYSDSEEEGRSEVLLPYQL